MNPTRHTSKCPNCHQPAAGNFCTHCGTSLQGATCPGCNAQLQSGSRFCNHCGYELGRAVRSQSLTPWFVAAAAIVVLVLVGLMTIGPWGPLPPGDTSTPQALPSFANSPEGEADRYFDQAMRAHEGGDMEGARFSGQMALNAYRALPSRNADQRFHIGLLYQITGDNDAILAQADSIEAMIPNHLFGRLLRGRVYRQSNNQAALVEVYRDFLAVYDSEISTNRQEYQAHQSLIESFREDATRAVGG
ncbi:MAG: zinc ribbon domain-containing protein [Gemmatimonadota bacterium]|nr:MAG: zinc ribbon domain-containing protein [Gemmatimonadota bacterium]